MTINKRCLKKAHKNENVVPIKKAEELMKTFVYLVLGGNKKCIEIGRRYAEEHFDDPEAFEIFSDLSITMLLDGVFDGREKVEVQVQDNEVLQDAYAMAQELCEALGIPTSDNDMELNK